MDIPSELLKIARDLHAYGNSLPPRRSGWYGLAKVFDIGEVDLDDVAYDLGFEDF